MPSLQQSPKVGLDLFVLCLVLSWCHIIAWQYGHMQVGFPKFEISMGDLLDLTKKFFARNFLLVSRFDLLICLLSFISVSSKSLAELVSCITSACVVVCEAALVCPFVLT